MPRPSITPDSLRDKLNCSICLELFTMPLSTPCGHSFCQKCIHEHWDHEVLQKGPFTCPECRKTFDERPEPSKNVNLCNVLEELRMLEEGDRSGPHAPLDAAAGVPRSVCQRHGRDLVLFCLSERRCVCCECSLQECRGHEMELIDKKRKMKQKELSDALLANGHQKEQLKGEIVKREQLTQNIKESCDRMVSGIAAQFDQLSKALEECRTLSIEAIRNQQRAAVMQAEENLGHLQRRIEVLEKHRTEAQQLLQNPDDVAFLNGLPLLFLPGPPPVLTDIPTCGYSQVDAVTKILPEVTRLLQVELPNALHTEMSQAQDKESPGSVSPVRLRTKLSSGPPTMSELRTKLYKDYRNLSFDPSTANKYIRLSKQNSKARHKVNQPDLVVPALPRTFQTWQVLCAEGFSKGHHYWEVEISKFFVEVGVTYDCLDRALADENKIGRNCFSWSLQVGSRCHSAWHNNKEQQVKASKYPKIGISLDCETGNLIFYGVNDGGLELLHSFTCLFSDTLFPAFWIGESTSVTLCQSNDKTVKDVVQKMQDTVL
ncbi:E3 ubiquitin-protein ligase TRIM65-like [Rhinophrynus dorsalis]